MSGLLRLPTDNEVSRLAEQPGGRAAPRADRHESELPLFDLVKSRDVVYDVVV
jgi:hypothetical protein